jgi:hypothetical protein
MTIAHVGDIALLDVATEQVNAIAGAFYLQSVTWNGAFAPSPELTKPRPSPR